MIVFVIDDDDDGIRISGTCWIICRVL